MNIAVIGSGNVGAALAQGLAGKHSVMFGVRDTNSPKTKAALAKLPGVQALSIEEAAACSEVIIITTAVDAVVSVAQLLGDCSGKVIIDATNSVSKKPEPYTTAFEALKAETNCPAVVKCFNTTGFENMANPVYQGVGIDMFCAGSSKHAKEVAARLAADIGFSACHDFGGDEKVPLLEQLALCWINLAILQKQGRDIAFRIVRR